MSQEEPDIVIASREQLLYSLAEAAEVEHNLMCCYLYAAWSLKTEEDDDVPPGVGEELRRWERAIVDVAIEEMTHLALVGNLLAAIGGVAQLNRPNFPIAHGYHPAEMSVRLAPFNRDTLQHFIFLERPEGRDEPDGAGFAAPLAYARGLNGLRLMPAAQDYLTVGHLYRSIEQGFERLSQSLGETALFCGDPALQVGPGVLDMQGLIPVTDLKSARQAIETIVEQGEGATSHTESGHYQRFVAVREAYERLAAQYPNFSPAHPAAVNPVMRRPPNAEGRVWVTRPDAAAALDLGNALYVHTLRFLAYGFAATDAKEKRMLFDAAISLMGALAPIGKELARLRANDADACNAGLSFATLRSIATPPSAARALPSLVQRLDEIAAGAKAMAPTPRLQRAIATLSRVRAGLPGAAPVDVAAPIPPAVGPQAVTPAEAAPAAPEVVEGRDLTLIFDSRRCIHARFCVTGAPQTFLANVEGPWLHPDATPVDALVEIAHACPSGAIAYRRKDGAANEAPPPVNLLRLRENGPYAIHAALAAAGDRSAYRATLCRCGASRNKPYCDGSHLRIGFAASGEPETISLDPLAKRDGELAVDPLRNGPLRLTGNLEICSGTGRVVRRVAEAKLCRCGQSRTKPFCDGSHRAAGFEAPGI